MTNRTMSFMATLDDLRVNAREQEQYEMMIAYDTAIDLLDALSKGKYFDDYIDSYRDAIQHNVDYCEKSSSDNEALAYKTVLTALSAEGHV